MPRPIEIGAATTAVDHDTIPEKRVVGKAGRVVSSVSRHAFRLLGEYSESKKTTLVSSTAKGE